MADQLAMPPPYATTGKTPSPGTTVHLVATLPSNNNRYNRSGGARAKKAQALEKIPKNTRTKSLFDDTTVIEGCAAYLHPEGDRYDCWDDKRVLITADEWTLSTLEAVRTAHGLLHQKMGPGVDFAEAEMALHIRVDEAGSLIAEYYLVDHRNRTIFWAEDVKPADLGIPNVMSVGALKSYLTPEYWTHVEYFCMHRALVEGAMEELTFILAHGRVDGLTSPGSTCPYSEKECSQFLESLRMLDLFDGARLAAPIMGYRTAAVARIWSAIARARHINSYGLINPRLDRLQDLGSEPMDRFGPSIRLQLWDLLSFSIAAPVVCRLTALFNGRVVYQRHWQDFLAEMRENWSRMSQLAGMLMIADAFLYIKGVSPLLAAISASIASASVFTAHLLHQNHPQNLLATGPDFSAYVMRYESYYHGLKPLAAFLTLPHALVVQSTLVFIAAIIKQLIHIEGGLWNSIFTGGALAAGLGPVAFALIFFASPSVARKESIHMERYAKGP